VTEIGTVYALIDPRDETPRYIGQTIQPLTDRLRGKYAPRVRAWMAELRNAGVPWPIIIAVRENVPIGQLLAAERDEITRNIVAGNALLNEQGTGEGRQVVRLRRAAEEAAAKQAAWRELADIAMDVLGGPLPPGEMLDMEIPEYSWSFTSRIRPGHREYVNSLITSDYSLWRSLSQGQDEATRQLQEAAHRMWGRTCWEGGDRFGAHLDRNVSVIAETPCANRGQISRHLALTVWYMVAMYPWRHLAELAGVAERDTRATYNNRFKYPPASAPDDKGFIAWAGRDAEVRKALRFLAARREGALELIPHRLHSIYEQGPGQLLGAVAAAYSGTAPEAVHRDIAFELGQLAKDHQLTQPMADLLMRLNPRALDSVFGRDVAAQLDRDLGLPAGTSSRVLLEFSRHVTVVNDEPIRRAIVRSAQVLPTVPLPEYRGWNAPSVMATRVISASLVRAGLAKPEHETTGEYLASVRALWAPRLAKADEEAA
jgi:hypothetical protein